MLIFEMFSRQKFIILNSILLIHSMGKIKPGATSTFTKDPRDDEIERLKNELKLAKEKMTQMNETLKNPPVNRYALAKTYIEKFETHFGANFEPDMWRINRENTPEAKNRETRRQRCDYILEKITHAHQVDHLLERLQTKNILTFNFCEKIADAYEIITEKLESGQGSSKNGSLFDDSEIDQCVDILTLSFTEFHPKYEGSDQFVQVAKSLYLDWLKKDAQIAVFKSLHDKEIESLEQKRNEAQAELEKHY